MEIVGRGFFLGGDAIACHGFVDGDEIEGHGFLEVAGVASHGFVGAGHCCNDVVGCSGFVGVGPGVLDAGTCHVF